MRSPYKFILAAFALVCTLLTAVLMAAACSSGSGSLTSSGVVDQTASVPAQASSASSLGTQGQTAAISDAQVNDRLARDTSSVSSTPQDEAARKESDAQEAAQAAQSRGADAEVLRAELGIMEDYRPSFNHGIKTAEYQRYIVLHDTEGSADPWGVIDWWDSNGKLVAAHFVVGKDGTVVQCVPLDAIAHHAGFGDAGHNSMYGTEDESRDDKLGTVPIGSAYPDYGMNSYSVGIEMVHIGGEGYYPEAQLEALDKLIAYIDAYYGFESRIIDHKAWRTSNGDTSPEFATYLANYQDHRTHS